MNLSKLDIFIFVKLYFKNTYQKNKEWQEYIFAIMWRSFLTSTNLKVDINSVELRHTYCVFCSHRAQWLGLQGLESFGLVLKPVLSTLWVTNIFIKCFQSFIFLCENFRIVRFMWDDTYKGTRHIVSPHKLTITTFSYFNNTITLC